MVAVTSVLVLIFMCNQFVHYLGDAAIGRLTPQAVLEMMCIQVPLLLGFMLPLGLFLGMLLTYGRLYVDNEMTVFFACGITRAQVLSMNMKFALIITTLIAALMFWVVPKMAWYRNHIIARAAISSPLEKISSGQFQALGDRWILYVENMSRDRNRVQNVFVAEVPHLENKPQQYPSLNVVIARQAFQKTDPVTKNTFLVLSNGYRYIGTPGKNNYQIAQFAEYGIRFPDKPISIVKQEEVMSLKELWHEPKTNLLAAAELQWRLSMPISAFILALFAVPLSQVKPRQGRFAQLLPAIIIYIAYINLLFLGQAWIQKGHISASVGMWWIHGLMLLLAVITIAYKFPLTKNRQ
jgi:lipopolysaccharide export system permease protein